MLTTGKRKPGSSMMTVLLSTASSILFLGCAPHPPTLLVRVNVLQSLRRTALVLLSVKLSQLEHLRDLMRHKQKLTATLQEKSKAAQSQAVANATLKAVMKFRKAVPGVAPIRRPQSHAAAVRDNLTDVPVDAPTSEAVRGPNLVQGRVLRGRFVGKVAEAPQQVPPLQHGTGLSWDYELTTDATIEGGVYSGVAISLRKQTAGVAHRPAHRSTGALLGHATAGLEARLEPPPPRPLPPQVLSEDRRGELNGEQITNPAGSPLPPWGPSSRPYIHPPAPRAAPACKRPQTGAGCENDSELLGGVEGSFGWL